MSIPLYKQIEQYILGQIEAGVWRENDKLPTEDELSKQFGVSRITAKSALNSLVHSGLLFRKRGKGTFVKAGANADLRQSFRDSQPNAAPGAGRRAAPVPAHASASAVAAHISAASAAEAEHVGRRKLIALLIPWMEFQYTSRLLAGIEAELSERGGLLIFKRGIGSGDQESEAIRQLLQVPVDGIIVVASRGEHFNDQLIRLVLNEFPVVFVEKSLRDIRANNVYCDTEQVGRLMGEYAARRGCVRVGLATYPSEYTVGIKERVFGFSSALVEHGIGKPHAVMTVPPELLERTSGGWSEDELRPFLDFLRAWPGLEAIAAADALIAELVGEACRQAGLEHMCIVCTDQPVFSRKSVFPQAYVDQSPYEMGRAAAKLLFESMDQGGKPREVVITPKLVERL